VGHYATPAGLLILNGARSAAPRAARVKARG
jgi:hypothetical protein